MGLVERYLHCRSFDLRTMAVVACAVSCATTPPPVAAPPPAPVAPSEVMSAPPPLPSVDKFDAKGFAASKVSPAECFQAATQLRQSSPDVGWAALKACVEKGTFQRGNFTSIRMLLSGVWNEDLAQRNDAPKLAARVMALRGGDVDGDLKEFHKVRLPAFAFETALAEPDLYKGRMLVIRAQGGQMVSDKGKPTIRLKEMSERAVQVWHEYREHGGATGQGSASATYTENGRTDSYSAQGSASWSGGSSYGYSGDQDVRNQSLPTGRSLVGRLPAADPFLLKDQDYVFLVRFDGVKEEPNEGDEEHPNKVGIVSIISYFKPSPMMIE